MSEQLKDLAAALDFAAWSRESGVGRQIANQWLRAALDQTIHRSRALLPTAVADSTVPAPDQTHPADTTVVG